MCFTYVRKIGEKYPFVIFNISAECTILQDRARTDSSPWFPNEQKIALSKSKSSTICTSPLQLQDQLGLPLLFILYFCHLTGNKSIFLGSPNRLSFFFLNSRGALHIEQIWSFSLTPPCDMFNIYSFPPSINIDMHLLVTPVLQSV